jgi:ligand-binding SRPBCC domain-containing protein
MSTTYQLNREQFIPRPLAEVFPFFADAGNLEAITPAFLNFRILTLRPIPMHPGALIDYQIKLFGLPLKWRTRIEEFEPPHRFVDVQLRGPYKLWHHTHEFREADGGTLMTDRVRYQLYLGPLGRLAHVLWVQRTLLRIFDHRRQTIERLLCGETPKPKLVVYDGAA